MGAATGLPEFGGFANIESMQNFSATIARKIAILLLGWLASFAPLVSAQNTVLKPNTTAQRKPVFVHYMPWFISQPVRGEWGWHWTMDRCNPDKFLPDGQREIASHFYPVIGPYDSSDPDLIEYHLQLMKLAGVDGVIADWYGTQDFGDYRRTHKATQQLFKCCRRFGMKFALCYEDQSVAQSVRKGLFSPTNAVDQTREMFRWVETNWFNDPSYARVNDRPVLLVFGPQYFSQADEWRAIFAPLKTKPFFCILNAPQAGADGVFG